MATASVRISSQHLQSGQFSGQQVRAVGRLVSHNGDTVTLQLAGEGPPATVHCGHDRSWEDKSDQIGKGFYEVIGTLQADGSIVSMTTVSMGDNIDMAMYSEMVTLTHQFPDLFESAAGDLSGGTPWHLEGAMEFKFTGRLNSQTPEWQVFPSGLFFPSGTRQEPRPRWSCNLHEHVY
eukprot:CAMPEP_0119063176 /NCGR_PEP_ID=MMETSP1178-20130426/6581_1 /TAXON_ID=33656 /ORGANISM="unid sp, Strain CCMP2000" /LENGTH=177 /DNA_ID=CAMNT_0007044515 /DNA_START=39 /DNA_END=573 /DNA_ORIENTATION=+